MLNLRQPNRPEQASSTGSGARHFSRFSISFRIPSDFLGNIGESLDHGQSERLHEDNDPESMSVADSAQEDLSPTAESISPTGDCSWNESESHDADIMVIREVARDALDLELLLESGREVSSSLRIS